MALFKKRAPKKEVIEKTMTILDAETREVEGIVDIIDPEVEEIVLEDENKTGGMIPALSDMEMKDMATMKSLRDMYPDQEDMGAFVTDACKAYKQSLDAAKEDLSDAELAKNKKEKEKVDTLVDPKAEKELHDKALESQKKRQDRANEIEEAERKRHEAAQKL